MRFLLQFFLACVIGLGFAVAVFVLPAWWWWTMLAVFVLAIALGVAEAVGSRTAKCIADFLFWPPKRPE